MVMRRFKGQTGSFGTDMEGPKPKSEIFTRLAVSSSIPRSEFLMRLSIQRHILTIAVAAFFLTLALGLFLVFGGDTAIGNDSAADGVTGEPLDDATKAQFMAGHLKFIAETDRIIVNENGVRQLVWDPPELPTLEESIRMRERAEAANDSSLLPLCTKEYLQYRKEQKACSRNLSDPRTPSFPVCNAIPDGIYFGPPSGPAPIRDR